MKRIAIVSVSLEFELDENMDDVEVEYYLANVDLPDNYVSDSFEFVKTMYL